MKTIRFQLLLLALFVMVGCQKDEMSTSMKKGSYTLVASIESNDSTSRTAVDENGRVTWVATDAIGVFGAQTKNAKFESISSGSNVLFVGNMDSSNEKPTLAYYPYDENASLDGNALSFTLPSEYSYTGQSYAPMLGIKQANGNFVFKHLVGLLKVTVKNMPENAKRLFVVSEGTEEKAAPAITGDVLVNDVTANNAILSITQNKGHEVSIDLKNTSVQETYTFYIPVPVGEYPKLSVKLEMNDGVIYMDKSVSNVNMTRAMMLDMPVLDAEKEKTGITAIVRGMVDIENPEGLKIESLIDDSELTEDEFTVEVFSNNLPQYVYVTDVNGNIRMMSHSYPKEGPLQIDARSTALALVTMLPPFLCSSSEVFEEVTKTIISYPGFSNIVTEVQKCIDENKEVLSTDNTALLQAISTLVEDLHEPISRSYIGTPIEGIETSHLDVARMALSNTLNIRNTQLYPPYECTIKDENGNLIMNEMIPSAEGYGGWVWLQDMFVNKGEHYGEEVGFSFNNPGLYSILCDRTTEKSKIYLFAHVFSDAVSCFGGVSLSIASLAELFNSSVGAWNGLALSFYTNILFPLNSGSITYEEAGIEIIRLIKNFCIGMYEGQLENELKQWIEIVRKYMPQAKLLTILKKMSLAMNVYDAGKGGLNLGWRCFYYVNSSPNINFNILYHDNPNDEIVCYSESALAIVKGNEQIGRKGEQLEIPLTVKVVTTADNGLPYWNDRLHVKFETTDGSGQVTNYVKVDEETKQSSVNWTLGYSGEQKVRVVAIDLFTETEISEPIYFTASFEGEEEEGTITTTEATNETQTTATLSGNIQGYEADDFGHRYGIIYSTDANPTASNGTIVYSNNIQEDGNYSVNVASLTENTTYYYRAFVRNHGDYVYADNVLNFTTLKPVEDNEGMTEREILIAFYNATDGDNWSKKSEWCSDKPLGKWYGVTTDDEGHVIEISFTDYNDSNNYNYRKGDANLSGLKYLRKLYINSADQLTSLNVSGCVSLEELSCYGNLLNSLVMNNCPKLKKIGVGGNKLTRLDVKHLESLELLYTGSVNNEYTTIDISGLKNLKKAEFSGSKLSAIECEDCLGLEELALRNSSFTNIDLSHLTNLKVLDIEYNKLQSLGSNELPSSLKTLNCYGNALTELSFYNFPNLEKLNCSNETLIKLDVSNLTKLKELDCSGSKITSLDVSTCTSLESLNCDGTSLTNINVKGLSNLKTLGLAGIEFVYELQHSTLVELDLTGCDNLEDLRLTNTYLKKIYSLPSKIDKTNTSRIKYWGTKNWEKYKSPNHYGGYQYPEFIY